MDINDYQDLGWHLFLELRMEARCARPTSMVTIT